MAATKTAARPATAGWLGHQGQAQCSKAAWPQLGESGLPLGQAPAAVSPVGKPSPFGGALAFDEADLARACALAAVEARRAEREAAAAGHEARIAAALETIAGSLDAADAVLAERRLQFREATAALAALATDALRMAPGAHAAAQIAEALTADCLARFDAELDLAVEVAPEIADALAARLESSAVVKRRAGRVTVEAVSSSEPGAVRLVWPNGSADWSIPRVQAAAAALIRQLADADREPPGQLAPEPSAPSPAAAGEGAPAPSSPAHAPHRLDRTATIEGEEA